MMRGYESTVCHYCKNREEQRISAEAHEAAWEDHPIEIGERKCRVCKIIRHWWFYWVVE